jgi:hypothetical protein
MATWGTQTVGADNQFSAEIDLTRFINFLTNAPVRRGLESYYKTGVLDPETERRLQVKNPVALAAIKAGNAPPLDEAIKAFFPREETSKPLTTQENVISALAPTPQPAQLLPPVSQGPALAPEFKLPTYTPQTISPGWQQDYTNKMVDILTTPQTRQVEPSLQDKVTALAGLQKSGQGDLATLIQNQLMPKTNVSAGGVYGYDPISGKGEMKFTPPEPAPRNIPVMTQEKALAAGAVPEGTHIVTPTSEGKLTGDAFKIDYLERAGRTPDQIIQMLYPEKEIKKFGADIQEYIDLHGKEPNAQEFIAWRKQLAAAGRAPDKPDKPEKTMPADLTRDLTEASQAISKKLVDDKTATQRLIAKWGKEYYSMIVKFIYPDKNIFGE